MASKASKRKDNAASAEIKGVEAELEFLPVDPVRFLGNRSTGKMGFAIAGRAAARHALRGSRSSPIGKEPGVPAEA